MGRKKGKRAVDHERRLIEVEKNIDEVQMRIEEAMQRIEELEKKGTRTEEMPEQQDPEAEPIVPPKPSKKWKRGVLKPVLPCKQDEKPAPT